MNQYVGTLDVDQFCSVFGESKEDISLLTLQLSIMVKNPAQQVATLEKAFKDLIDNTTLVPQPEDGKLHSENLFMPKISHEGNKLLIGFQVP